MAGPRAATTEFRFGLGHPALEFIATLARRREEPHERLETAADLSRWLEQSGLVTGARCTEQLLDEARKLREAFYEVLDAARCNRRPAGTAVALVNRWARQPRSTPQLDASFRIVWIGPDPARAALTQLAAAAIELVAGPELERVRNCADPTCSLMFIDRSRPGRRRWCSMDRCGNRAKTSRYRRQHSHPSRATRTSMAH
jgi:predicted RNA-binding Zn ribbon-like protein